MEIREETIEKTVYETKKTYIANDGTEFKNREECEKYEETAQCAINSMFKKLKIQQTDSVGEDETFNLFMYEDTMHAVKIETLEELEVVNKWICFKDPTQTTIGTEKIGTIQLINEYDGGVWVVGTPEELKDRYCNAIDGFCNELIEKTEETKGENA